MRSRKPHPKQSAGWGSSPVDAGPDGTYGNILVAAGNKAFRDDIEELTKRPFVNNTPYYLSLPKDMNFEDFIYRSAILGQPLHTYVNLYQMGLWVEMYLLPLRRGIMSGISP